MPNPVKSLLLVAAAAVLTVVALDVLIGRTVPLPHTEYETVEALADYAAGDPEVLVLGSSHARSLMRLRDWYADQAPPLRMAVMPIEGGKLYAYDWLLEHRLQPLIDARRDDGSAVRGRLRELVLVTNYWDACGAGKEYPNLPARAWALSDYLADFAQHGATAYNTNYIDQRWNELTAGSTLIRDRGAWRIIRTLREKIRPRSEEDIARTDAEHLARWVAMIEENDLAGPSCDSRTQVAAFDRILAFARERGLRTTIVLWASIPRAQTPGTIAVADHYRDLVLARAGEARVIDLRPARVLADEDYRADLDHLHPSGHEKLRQWFLAGPFADLADRGAGARP